MSNIELMYNSGIFAYHFIPTYAAWRPGQEMQPRCHTCVHLPHLPVNSSWARSRDSLMKSCNAARFIQILDHQIHHQINIYQNPKAESNIAASPSIFTKKKTRFRQASLLRRRFLQSNPRLKPPPRLGDIYLGANWDPCRAPR